MEMSSNSELSQVGKVSQVFILHNLAIDAILVMESEPDCSDYLLLRQQKK
jgi:hypothetical protein